MLKGQAKTDYQRDYMRRRRGVRPVLDLTALPVRPTVRPTVKPTGVYGEVDQPARPEVDADGALIPDY